MRNYKNYEVYQAAMTLAEDVYETTKQFPGDEKYGLTSQIRRAAVSIPSNIAKVQVEVVKRNLQGISKLR